MANWSWDLRPLVKECYTDEFPMEIRGLLADFLKKDLSFLNWNSENPSSEERQLIYQFIRSMKSELTEIFNNLPTYIRALESYKEDVVYPQYKRIQENINIAGLFRTIIISIREERKKIDEARATGVLPVSFLAIEDKMPHEQVSAEINADVQSSRSASNQIFERLKQLKIDFAVATSTLPLGSTLHPDHIIAQHIRAMDGEIIGCITSLNRAKDRIIAELEKFKDRLRFCPVAFIAEAVQSTYEESRSQEIAKFKEWFNSIHESLSQLSDAFGYFHFLCRKIYFVPVSRSDQIPILQQELISVSNVIEKQSKQIMQTGVGAGDLIAHILYPVKSSSVELILTNKDGATKVATTPADQKSVPEFVKGLKFGELNTKYKKLNENTHQFKKVTVEKSSVDRSHERGKQESVVNEKFYIYVRATVRYKSFFFGQDQTIVLHTVSLPLAIISYSSYMVKCWPQLIWFNACPTESRLQSSHGLEGADKVPWQSLIKVIDREFVNLGKSLTNEQKAYLKEKLLRESGGQSDLVNEEQFLGKNFTTMIPEASESSVAGTSTSSRSDPEPEAISFAEWLFHCVKFLNTIPKSGGKGLRKMWEEEKLIGFMSKDQVENKLYDCPSGTFMIRFPEKLPMHIGLYFYNFQAKEGQEKLLKLVYNIENLKTLSLEERICGNDVATNLYSNYRVQEFGHVVRREVAFPPITAADSFNVGKYNYILNIPMKIKESFPRWFLNLRDST